MRVPIGIREQPAWIFIGFLFTLVGLGYVTGFTESTISKAVGDTGLRWWGVALTVSGGLLIAATVKARPALEKLALRILICNMLAYVGWLVAVAPMQKLATTLLLSGALSVLAEFRVRHLTLVIDRAHEIENELRSRQ